MLFQMDFKRLPLTRALRRVVLILLMVAGAVGDWSLVVPSVFAAGDPQAAGEDISLDTIENSNLKPLDIDNRYDIYITKDELGDLMKDLSWKKGDFKFIPYGYIWTNTGYNSATGIPGDFVLYAQSPEISASPDFFVDARQSRIGMFVEGPKVDLLGKTNVRGVVEIDFEGTMNGTRNKGGLQLRKAFVELVNKERDLRLAFGQDWEVISPLYPQMLSYLPAGFAGNIGYRRAQVRLEKGRTYSANFKTLTQVALADDIIGDFTSVSAASGKTSGVPLVEGRYAMSFWEEARGGLPITVGLSAHFGQESYNFDPIAGTWRDKGEKDVAINTWSVNVDGDLPITKRMRLQGEYYFGENLSSFCGGINQGVDLYRRAGLRDMGGWLSLHTSLTEKLCNNTGYAIDKVNDRDLVGTSVAVNGIAYARTQSSVLFTNFLYSWTSFLMTGAEFAYYRTDFRRADVRTSDPTFLPMDTGDLFRIDLAIKYSF
ncbi:MAG: hypothetical protein Q4G68_06575 [Planctomycetia bacterium]|nr:hypothetical protein [Planctomycetia bacterium]